jgi:hypothetical protein
MHALGACGVGSIPASPTKERGWHIGSALAFQAKEVGSIPTLRSKFIFYLTLL